MVSAPLSGSPHEAYHTNPADSTPEARRASQLLVAKFVAAHISTLRAGPGFAATFMQGGRFVADVLERVTDG